MEAWIGGIVILLLLTVLIKSFAGDSPIDTPAIPMVIVPPMVGSSRGSSGMALGVFAVILLIVLLLAVVAMPGL
jgi:hypothetical protein